MEKSFTLLEVIIAIFIVLVAITATLLFITKTVTQMTIFSSQLIGAYLAQEGIEIIRNIRDTNWLEDGDWDEGLALPDIDCSGGCEADYTATTAEDPHTDPSAYFAVYGDNFLYIDDADGFYKYISTPDPNDIQTKFKRKITIEPGDLDGDSSTNETLKVTVEVTWTEKGTPYSHKAQEILYDWR